MKAGVVHQLIAVIAIGVFAAVAAGQTRDIRINLVDPAGAAVTNATVRVASGKGELTPCTLDDDAFICKANEKGGVSFDIAAPGFKPLRPEYREAEITCCEYVFVLQVAAVNETVVTVGRTESLLAETPESIAVLSRARIETTAAPTLDDALRQVPGFSTFRRSSSRNANPTTQGVSLRGVGASGASRSVVLFDSVPLNDPFGGWVQWNRVSPVAVEAIEVLRGGASNLYGGSGLSGAIDLRPRSVDTDFAFSGEAFGGSQRTVSGSAFAGGRFKGWSGDVSGGHFQTRGFIPVAEEQRGPVDSFAGVKASNISLRGGRELGSFGEMFFRHNYFDESRTNGTPAQINRTHSRQFVFGGRFGFSGSRDKPPATAGGSAVFDWRFYGGTQGYDQTFSAVAADRASETLTRIQRSPSQNFGFLGQLTAGIDRHTIAAGVEGREVRGASDEIGFANGRATSLTGSGGRERSVGAFAKDVIAIGKRVVVAGSIRFDRWENLRGYTSSRSLVSGTASAASFPDRDESAFSPQASLLINASDQLSFHASASKSFRSPTLNELYRGFRVGNVVTNANENLRAERAINFEAGTAFRKGRSSLRVTGFITRIDGAISNVTLISTPSLITRQRQNAGQTRTAGIEFDAETRIKGIDLNAGYLFADSRVTEFPSSPDLIDKFIPQVPRHQFTFQGRYPWRSWVFAVQGRAAGEQFDDDLNQFRLEPYFQLDAFASKRFYERVSAFFALENVFNTKYSVGRTPVRTINSPISARAGIRFH